MTSDQKNIELDDKKYRSFLLRLWQVEAEKKRVWRFSLEDAITGERKGFVDLDEITTYLTSTVCTLNKTDYESSEESY